MAEISTETMAGQVIQSVKKECGVLVVGAGVAGIAAAVAAAREGITAVLVEKNSFPGGGAVMGRHRFICGLYSTGDRMPEGTLNEGIVREVVAGLRSLAPSKTALRRGKVFVLPFLTGDLISVFSSLGAAEDRLEVCYDTRAVSVQTEGGNIVAVTARGFREELDITPGAVVDCSGQGIIIALSGARYRMSPLRRRQLAGYAFTVRGLREADDMLAVKVPYYLTQAANGKKVPVHLKFTTFAAGDQADEGYLRLNLPPAGRGDRNKQAKEDAVLAHRYLSRVVSAFRGSAIADMSDEVVDREGLRLRGEYTLTEDDVLNARKFPDGVVKSAWPIEFWDQGKGPRYGYLNPGEYYEIPLRCLKSIDISNLYCAGRCISASPQALGSIRVMGTCLSLGEEAGRAAAHSISRKSRGATDTGL